MSNLRAALMKGVFGALSIESVLDLAPVCQHIIEDTQPPVVLIREISLEPEGAKDGELYRATISVDCLYRGTKGTEAAAIVDAVEAALLSGTLTADGLHPVRAHTVRSDGPVQGEDGVTYEGTVTAEALVQPA